MKTCFRRSLLTSSLLSGALLSTAMPGFAQSPPSHAAPQCSEGALRVVRQVAQLPQNPAASLVIEGLDLTPYTPEQRTPGVSRFVSKQPEAAGMSFSVETTKAGQFTELRGGFSLSVEARQANCACKKALAEALPTEWKLPRFFPHPFDFDQPPPFIDNYNITLPTGNRMELYFAEDKCLRGFALTGPEKPRPSKVAPLPG